MTSRGITALQIVAVIFAVAMMGGEAFRTWGTGRPVHHWIDDQILGILLLFGAWMLRRPSPTSFAIMAGAWGFSIGMIFPSFFGKLFEPGNASPGNFDLGLLTALIGLAFIVSITGLFWTIRSARG